jgi:acyl dehydratase
MRMFADGVLNRAAGLGGGGLQEIRWPVPTRPGDRLRGLVLVVEKAPTSRTPHRGKFTFRGELRNQRDEVAMHLTGMGFLRRRHPPA